MPGRRRTRLVVTRRPGERLVIGEGEKRVEVTIVSIRPQRVRIAIEACSETRLMRAELLDRMLQTAQ